MAARQVAAAHARSRGRLATAARRFAARLWRQVDRRSITSSWAQLLPQLHLAVAGAQRAAAASSDGYVERVLSVQGFAPRPSGLVVPAALAGVASDGRALASLLAQPAIAAKVALAQGATIDAAMATGLASVELIAHTQVSDAGRVADQVALVAQEQTFGYVRMLVGDSCARCIILAGKWYRWNQGFQRHPADDCVHIPAAEDDADDLRTDPMKAFHAMTEAEQDSTFGKASAQAIRDGADIYQVVNARRGITAAGAASGPVTVLRGGRDRTTLTGTTRRGLAGARLRGASRLMPEALYRQAGGDRDEALRLLRQHGYIL